MEHDISRITDELYVSSLLKPADEPHVRSLGIRFIISMIFGYPVPAVYGCEPYKSLWIPTFDFPLLPIPVFMLRHGVVRALPIMQKGEPVLSFCRQGRHRSVAMAAALLIARGHSSAEAMEMLKAGRKVADPHIFYIKRQILLFEKNWKSLEP